MKTYFVFGGSNYYPAGGMEDFQASFESYEKAEAFVEANIVKREKSMVRPRYGSPYEQEFVTYTWGEWAKIEDISGKLGWA